MANDPKDISPLQCEVSFHLSLHEVTEIFGITKETVIEMLDEGIMRGKPDTIDEWVFDDKAMHSIHTALRLHHDLGINFAGASLALDLLKEIERLESILSR